ncbi:hypothetical protein A2Y85_08275 [candidate division WOR-3 bacterium RBG_13_43_14]|uniref:Aminotransferase class V domain-containing protein n=1 Tax=candidate division WOR-3 bacterium RBG_13_43_14 TaxID=1802590 RepID=A0A1F4U1M8_UNCW3|nr:MAG: hypothetical protein A2Y85_08275 [candidate division WOR-3 bacterium RBG_13_43_14]
MNKKELRQQFPITQKFTYLNHAGTGPLSSRARKVIDDCLCIYQQQAEFDLDDYWRRIHNARLIVARLLGAQCNEIAFTANTSEGIFIGLSNLPLKGGDKIIVMDEVFPAVRYVVDNNFPHLDKIYVSFAGRSGVDVVSRYLDDHVRVVVVDYVQYLSGSMIDIDELGKFLHERDIYLVVDGIQAIGAVECDLSRGNVDILACGAAKWLLGPSGIGFVYVNKGLWQDLKKIHTGWLGADWRDFYDCSKRPLMYEDARKFEIGTRNVMGILALVENIQIILELGIQHVHNEIIVLKNRLREELKKRGCTIITPESGPQSGILTIQHPESNRVFQRLIESKVMISLRSGNLRFSPHFYNTVEEIEFASRQFDPRYY